MSRLRRVFMNNIFANLTTIKGFGNNHTPSEIQRRLLFASHFKQALASGEHFADKKRNKIKSLDEYYVIRANMNSLSRIQCERPRELTKALLHRQNPWILILVALLSICWLTSISSILGIGPLIAYPLVPVTMSARIIAKVAAASSGICTACWIQLAKGFPRHRCIKRAPFIPRVKLRHTRRSTSIVENIAKRRALGIVESVLLDVKHSFVDTEHAKLSVINQATKYLFNVSSIVDSYPYGMHNNLLLSSVNKND